jgi:signal transduction histidine kinase
MTGSAYPGAVSWLDGLPRWWLAAAWAAMIGYSVFATGPDDRKIAVGVLMTVAVVAVQFTRETQPVPGRTAAVLVATGCGLAVIVLAGGALGYVPVLVVAPRLPFGGRVMTAWVVADTILFGVAVAIASRHITPVIAGVGIPLLVQRSLQGREIVRQRDRAEALLVEVEAGREAEAQAAALRERGRIAREMHDVLAHSLAGLSLQLQAIRAVAARSQAGPELNEPLERAAQLARDGLAEARDAMSTLRDPVGLGLDALPALVERHPGAATITLLGEPGRLSPPAGHAVYRAVQEALTNAARYAPGSPVEVALQWRPDAVVAEVLDSGPAAGHDATPGQGTGLGLAGMQERVELAGGTVSAGPRGDRPGWRVEISVPRPGSAS